MPSPSPSPSASPQPPPRPVPVISPLSTRRGHRLSATCVAATPDVGVAVTTSPDATAREWDFGAGAGAGGEGCAARVVGGLHSAWTRGCAVAADGGVAATAGYDGVVCVWEAGGGARGGREGLLVGLRREGYEHANGCAMTPDGGVLVATFYKDKGLGGEVVVGELQNVRGEEGMRVAITAYEWERSNLRECCVSADGGVVGLTSWRGSGGWWYVDVISARTGGTLRDSVRVSGKFPGLAMTAAGDFVVVADEKALAVWAARGGNRPTVVMQGYQAPSTRHCAVTPRGNRIVAAVAGSAFGVWDGHSGEMMARLEGHGGAGRGCAVSVCGTRFVTCCSDAAVRLFDASGDIEPLDACAVSEAEARSWFRAAVARCGSDGSLSYQRAATALYSLLLNAGHASRACISGDVLEDALEAVDAGQSERIGEDAFVGALRAVGRHLGIADARNLSENWWTAFESAADSVEGLLSKRQAKRILLRVAQEERAMEGMLLRPMEEDAVLVDERLAQAEAERGAGQEASEEQVGRGGDDVLRIGNRGGGDGAELGTGLAARRRNDIFGVGISLYIEIAALLMFRGAVGGGDDENSDQGYCPPSGCSSPIQSSDSVDANVDDSVSETICVICQCEFAFGDALVRLPACGHEYHYDCLKRYVTAASRNRKGLPLVCPIDRQPIVLLGKNVIDCLPRRRYYPTVL